MAGLFLIHDHGENIHVMSDLHIRNRIIRESEKSNYDWLAPASELLRVCNCKGFNKSYAKDIKVAIVKCYTDFLKGDVPISISFAYQAMQELKEYSNDEEVQKVRKNFARNYVSRAIFWVGIGNFHETLYDAKNKYIKSTVERMLSDETYHPSFEDLDDEFSKIKKQGVEDGTILFEGMNFSISEAIDEDKHYKDFVEYTNSEKTPVKTMGSKPKKEQ